MWPTSRTRRPDSGRDIDETYRSAQLSAERGQEGLRPLLRLDAGRAVLAERQHPYRDIGRPRIAERQQPVPYGGLVTGCTDVTDVGGVARFEQPLVVGRKLGMAEGGVRPLADRVHLLVAAQRDGDTGHHSGRRATGV